MKIMDNWIAKTNIYNHIPNKTNKKLETNYTFRDYVSTNQYTNTTYKINNEDY